MVTLFHEKCMRPGLEGDIYMGLGETREENMICLTCGEILKEEELEFYLECQKCEGMFFAKIKNAQPEFDNCPYCGNAEYDLFKIS